jgi:hypothetical protein
LEGARTTGVCLAWLGGDMIMSNLVDCTMLSTGLDSYVLVMFTMVALYSNFFFS